MFGQVVVSGMAAGAIYALVAVGFVVIYKATEVVNFAQGELVMLGAYWAITFHVIFRLPYAAAFALALLGTAAVGLLVELAASRPLLKESVLSVIIATIAVGMILRNVARLVWGPELWPFPPVLSRAPFRLVGLLVTPESLWVTGATLGCMAACYLFFAYHRVGKGMRAVSQNRTAAALVGISVRSSFSVAWGISAVLAGVAGVLLAPLQPASPSMGLVAIPAFAAAILGGFDSMAGAVVGGFLLGIVQNLAGFYISSVFKDIIAFLILIAILVVRPAGLFGTHAAQRV